MKKKILITMSFLVFILAFQGVSTNAVRAQATVWHASIDEFFGQMVKGKQNNTWTIETLTPTPWEWSGSGGNIYLSNGTKVGNYANHTLTEGDMILHNWTQKPNYYTDIGLAGPINYTGLDVLYGDVGSWTKMNRSADETGLDFLTVPMYIHKAVFSYTGQMYDPGLYALQAYWFQSFSLPDLYPVGAAHQYVWTYDNVNGTIWNTGEHGVKGTVIKGIITSNWVWDAWGTSEYGDVEYALFDVYYDAITGILTELVFPSEGYVGGNIANATNLELSKNLEELHIVFDGDLDDLYDLSNWGRDTPYTPPVVTQTVYTTEVVTNTETKTKTVTETKAATPGFIALAAIFTMAALVIGIRRRRKK